MVLPGTIIAGRYKLGEKIGKGSFGEIYSATQFDTNKKIALKFVMLVNTNRNQKIQDIINFLMKCK